MVIKNARLLKGHHSFASQASDPNEDRDFGQRPLVGQGGKAYNSENAHGQIQRRTRSDASGTAGDGPASGPIDDHGRGWPVKSPSKRD